ncbi:symmetrical bis(5'-nucleosyl)-tetraphosphatase [Aquabacterium fontiphilum]|uniref:symmetrical bis(5'-nucleosyl)-tetraphosphatase n=1 Tax=Aquabacterium fontiphilum TaxID=450365 RepID=UPI0013766C40|nr:symmetrical bis(5'-nucleosyl)-tetraphosphatase [Aquabacterium fontiphilum]NBD21288.1 symmetrical bis(5'-nucleosyl)-tetraphosphatase [Aquabacterium fontiphilum]
MNYLIGDVQGCCGPLETLLATLGFSPSRDHVYVLGDLVNRGPDSLGVLKLLRGLEGSATCLLGNHDLHLLAVACGVRQPHRNDTIKPILEAPDRVTWLDWLRHRPLAVSAHGWLMVHAGVLPQWTRAQTLALADEVTQALQADDWADHLQEMYGNQPDQWDDRLTGADRRRCIINALTRLRFCSADGRMDFAAKEGAGQAPAGCMPWFDVPGRRTAGEPIAFGHWSTLGLVTRPDLLSLDTGCVWGGQLTAAALDDESGVRIIQLPCPQAQKPG